MTLLRDALRGGRGLPLVNVRTSSGACGSQPPFPGNCVARLLQNSRLSLYPGGNNNKIRKPAEVLTGHVKRRGSYHKILPVFLQTSTCFFQRDAGCREHTPAAPGEQYSPQLQSPCSFLSPLPEISTLLLKPKYWLCPFVVGSGPGLQLFLCKHKGRARSVCVSSLILTAVVLTFGGVLHAQELSANLLRARENRLASASLCFPHLICPANSKHSRRREA